MNNIVVKEVDIEEALKVNKNVIEFENPNATKEDFEQRYQDLKKVILVAYLDEKPIGYIVGYDRFQDNESFYCWMAGVDYRYRRHGALTALMKYQMDWARKQGYKILKIRTRNNRREIRFIRRGLSNNSIRLL